MKRIVLFSITILFSLYGLSRADKPPQTSVLKGRNGRHTFTLRLAIGPFRKEKHKITGYAPWYFIDGKQEVDKKTGKKNWYGTDGGLPYHEFYSFDVVVDGRRWAIPKRLWRDCYDPRIGVEPNQWRDVWAWLSKDGKRLTVKMHGSDGAGSYSVLWHFRRNGNHSRKVYGAA